MSTEPTRFHVLADFGKKQIKLEVWRGEKFECSFLLPIEEGKKVAADLNRAANSLKESV